MTTRRVPTTAGFLPRLSPLSMPKGYTGCPPTASTERHCNLMAERGTFVVMMGLSRDRVSVSKRAQPGHPARLRNMHHGCTTPHPGYGKTPDFSGVSMAVTVGFEPTVGGYPTQLFESCTFGRSDTSPRTSLRHRALRRESRAGTAALRAGHQAAATSAWVRRMPSVEPAGARPMPHSVATPNAGAKRWAAAMRRCAPSTPSSRCTSPR